MNMTQPLSDSLKQKRTEKNLTLNEVSKTLHIQTRYLEALENNRFDLLPSLVQARGFARLYADFLGIDDIDTKLNTQQTDQVPVIEDMDNSADLSSSSMADLEPSSIDIVEVEEVIAQNEELADENANEGNFKQYQPDLADQITSNDIFKLIGNKLLTRREALGISLEEVERHTHLKTHYLKFLEEGNFHKLPSPVQGKGMLSNYARFLDLDNEEVLLLFADALQTRREEMVSKSALDNQVPSTKKPAPSKPSNLKRFITPDLLIGSSVIVLIFFFSLWTISTINSQRDTALDSTPPPISDVLSNQPVLDRTILPIDQATSTPVIGQQNAGTIPEAPENSDLLEETIPTKDDKSLQLYIIASDRAWVQVISDTKSVFNGRVQPGNAYPFSAETQLELVTGNAAALQVFFNQQDLGTLGVFGEVLRLIFNNEGVLTPTPLFTPTFTPTAPPTLTPLPSPTIPSPTVTPFIP